MAQASVLTLNINAGFDLSRRRFVLPALRDALRSVDADVVLLQEVLGAHARHARRHLHWPPQPQHAYLADGHWPHQAYGCNLRFAEGDLGNAILSRLPIVTCHNRDLSVAGHEPRGMLHAVLFLPDAAPLHVVNVHLGLLEAHRRQQIAHLCALATALPREEALVIAGDFNDWRRHSHVTLRDAGLREAFEETDGRLARTFPSACPLLCLDRIYLRNATVQGIRRLAVPPWSRLSDHVALLVQLEM